MTIIFVIRNGPSNLSNNFLFGRLVWGIKPYFVIYCVNRSVLFIFICKDSHDFLWKTVWFLKTSLTVTIFFDAIINGIFLRKDSGSHPKKNCRRNNNRGKNDRRAFRSGTTSEFISSQKNICRQK